MNNIGITEQGDAGLNYKWIETVNSVSAAILITKELNDTFIANVVDRNNVIVHATVTGWGGSIIEPNVPPTEWSLRQLCKLHELGFPMNRVVLRVDPIFLSDYGLRVADNVLIAASNTGIKRVRFSFLDLYRHVIKRFRDNNVPESIYKSRNIDISNMIFDMMSKYSDIYEFEACAESVPEKYLYFVTQCGCISQKDMDILGIDFKLGKPIGQRVGCMCPINKKELLSSRHPCKHKCLYCYWLD
jgi:DNA repair photolyase